MKKFYFLLVAGFFLFGGTVYTQDRGKQSEL